MQSAHMGWRQIFCLAGQKFMRKRFVSMRARQKRWRQDICADRIGVFYRSERNRFGKEEENYLYLGENYAYWTE